LADRAGGSVIGVMLIAVALCGWLTSPASAAARVSSLRDARLLTIDEVLDLVDVLRLGTVAGLSARASLELSFGVLPSQVCESERACLDEGGSVAEVLAGLAQRVEDTAGIDAVALAVRYGFALEPVLDRVEMEAGATRRRVGEARVRGLPVRLLFPLVMLVLPAFVLVGVVPVVAAGLGP
jgi:hypothetical protein